MHKSFTIVLALLVLIGVMPLLGACHTTAGAGRDISATGHAITGSANKNTP
ncbi:MAG TPA: entericidin A/B family lipoprotein [Acetobacteraceae bacterium]|nr:entericidin A/B family lipoprotein [Acetobacteraceae bacterium]